MENLLQQKEKEREENARIARQVCTEEELEKVGRAEPEKDGEDVTDALNRNLKRMKKRIEKIEGHAMSEEEEQRIEREVEQKEQYCNKRRRLIGDAEKPYEKIQSMIDYRTEILRKNCNVKGEKLDNHFKATLYQRQYTGNLKVCSRSCAHFSLLPFHNDNIKISSLSRSCILPGAARHQQRTGEDERPSPR